MTREKLTLNHPGRSHEVFHDNVIFFTRTAPLLESATYLLKGY